MRWIACSGAPRWAPTTALVFSTVWACGGPPADRPDETAGWFRDVTAPSGLPDSAGRPDGVYYLPEIMQGGVALFDADGDGDLDILHARPPPPGRPQDPAPNRLYLREPGGTYIERARAAGIADPGYGQGVAVGDADNDGDADVYVANYGADAFYVNNGDGSFTELTQAAGFGGERWSVSAAFCDYDRDGWLDLFVVHYVRYDDAAYCQDESGRQEYCGPQVFPGEPDRLYRNTGGGRFVDVTEAAGLVLPEGGRRARGLGALCADLTGDGIADLYAANDGESNQLWVGRGDGTFREEGIARGVAVNRHGKPEASMGVTLGDSDGDGRADLFMTHLVQEHNTLYRADAAAIFLDQTLTAGLAGDDAPLTGFGCAFCDFDQDGDEDLLVANGRVRRGPRLDGAAKGRFWRDYAEPGLLYVNEGDGRFRNASALGGALTAPPRVARGLATGDLDGDGDPDVVVSTVDDGLRLLRNDAPPAGGHWLRVRARTRGRDALGARLRLEANGRTQTRWLIAAASYASSSEAVAHFGLGAAAIADALTVDWPDGSRERFPVGAVDRELLLVQGEGDVP